MKKWSLLLAFLLCFSFTLNVEAHPGRTDSNGGHNCSEKSKAKGLCTGYHYHNGGGSSAPQTSPGTAPKVQEPVYNPQVYYDNGYKAGNTKGIEMGYQKGNQNVESTDSNDDFIEGWTAGFKIGYAEGLSKKEAEEKLATDKVDGAAKGKVDGGIAYTAGKEVDAFTYVDQSSETYIQAYKETFISSWETAKKIEACYEEGYNQGLKQDGVVISKACEEDTLRSEFEKGHKKGVQERDIREIEKLTKQGESLGYEVAKLVIPKEVKKASYKTAFEKGYDDGENKRKEEVQVEGYDSAFKQVDFVNEVYTGNEVLSAWYKEGFESNEIAEEIKMKAQTLGEESDEYVIEDEYKVNDDSIRLYDSLFKKGQEIKEQREREQRNLMLSIAAIGVPAAGGFYFWQRKRKNKAQ